MSLHRQHLLVATAVLWSGCASTPELSEPPPIEIPESWTASSAQRGAPDAWLDDFNSPELQAIVEEALANNADLERVSAVFTQSIAEARITGADLKPSVNFGLDGARQQISTFGPNSTGGIIFEDYNLGLSLDWEIDLWGRVRNLTSVALAQVEASRAELEGARLSLAAQVAKAWFNVIEAQLQVTEAKQNAVSYRENQKTLESRFKRGLTQGLDLRRVRTLAASAEADLATRLRALDSASRNLELLLGRYPEGASTPEDPLPELPPAIPAGLPADLIARRPDIITAERQLAAADQDLEAKKKDLLPKISLTASAGTTAQAFNDLLDGDFSVWSLAGNLTQPVFQGGRIAANIDRSASIRDQARAAYWNAALQAFLEVESALAAETYLKDEYIFLEIAAEEATAAEKQAWESYRNGTTDFLDVLDAQRTAATARGRVIAARNLLLQNRIDLYLSLGGPFETES